MKNIKRVIPTVMAVSVLASTGMSVAYARDQVSIVGSSTVYPFATVVAEQFGKTSRFKTPKIESTGSGGGLKLFCAGIGVQFPDVANASRAIKDSEIKKCADNGVTDITEIKIGYDGITLGQSKMATQLELSRRELYLALAKQVPDSKDGSTLVDNPYRTWKDLDARLPATKIEVLGPPPTSGTRDAFLELVMEKGCKGFAVFKSMNKKARKAACHEMREDGAFIEAGENDNLIVQKLQANPSALGIFGYSFLDQNQDKIQGVSVEGVAPEFETIASGTYKVSRPLYFYVKKAHVGVIPGLKEYVAEFVSERAFGEGGYLSDRGLIPLPVEDRAQVAITGTKFLTMSQAK